MSAGRSELGAIALLLLVTRPPVWLFSYFLVGPGLGVNLAWLADFTRVDGALAQWLLVDLAAYIAIVAVTIIGAIRGQVTVAAWTSVASTAWYVLTLLTGGVLLFLRDGSADLTVPIAAVLMPNALIILLGLRAVSKSRNRVDAQPPRVWPPTLYRL